jgi:hypothetical protein
MKRTLFVQKSFFYATLIFLLFTGCQKEQLQALDSQPNGTVSSNRPKAIARSNDLVVQTFTRDMTGNPPRQYRFVYAANGNLDSIVAAGGVNYVYRVYYKGSHLDSVILVQDNRIVSTVRDFQYKGNLITSYNYYNRIGNQPFPTVYSVEYDKQKRIITIQTHFLNTWQEPKRFTYDANDNVVSMNNATYVYDDQLNPLHLVPDLFAIMFEEQWIWEFALSLHNSVSKTYSNGQLVQYQNQYNDSGQLVGKKFFDTNSNGNNTHSFTYQ